MAQKLSARDARLNLVVPLELKSRLVKTASAQGKKVSALVRESIEDKLAQMERKLYEDNMREAYLEMAGENLDIAEDFKHLDAENI